MVTVGMTLNRKPVLSLLLLMVLLNVTCRYPLTSGLPLGSDTYFALDLSRFLASDGHARWILNIWSYVGLFPASYPNGIMFMNSESQMLCGLDWYVVPWVVDTIFSILLVFSGFVFLRAFRVRSDYAAVFSGLMALSPMFLYFTLGQVAPRALVVPLIILAVAMLYAQGLRADRRTSLLLLFFVGAMTIHRTGMMILLFVVVWASIAFILPRVSLRRESIKVGAFLALMVTGIVMVCGPFLPVIRILFGDISDISSSYRLAEWEFSSGLLFSGDSAFAIIGNLVANYVGSIGLIILLFPLGLIVLYPRLKYTPDQKYFLLCVFLIFSPFVWNAQYTQMLLFPFFYVLGAMVVQTRHDISMLLRSSLLPRSVIRYASSSRSKRLGIRSIAVLIALSFIFSPILTSNRLSISSPLTSESSDPSSCTVNLGNYLGTIVSFEAQSFVSNSGLLDRRIRWLSGWDAPVSDVAPLMASGYLELSSEDFSLLSGQDISELSFLTSLLKPDKLYVLDPDAEDYDLARLSWGDIYGFLRLYYQDTSYSLGPGVSTAEAGISVVIEILAVGNSMGRRLTLEGLQPSPFLSEVSATTYVFYEDEELKSFLAATPIWS